MTINKAIGNWTIDEVQSFLKAHESLYAYHELFKEQKVDGPRLLNTFNIESDKTLLVEYLEEILLKNISCFTSKSKKDFSKSSAKSDKLPNGNLRSEISRKPQRLSEGFISDGIEFNSSLKQKGAKPPSINSKEMPLEKALSSGSATASNDSSLIIQENSIDELNIDSLLNYNINYNLNNNLDFNLQSRGVKRNSPFLNIKNTQHKRSSKTDIRALCTNEGQLCSEKGNVLPLDSKETRINRMQEPPKCINDDQRTNKTSQNIILYNNFNLNKASLEKPSSIGFILQNPHKPKAVLSKIQDSDSTHAHHSNGEYSNNNILPLKPHLPKETIAREINVVVYNTKKQWAAVFLKDIIFQRTYLYHKYYHRSQNIINGIKTIGYVLQKKTIHLLKTKVCSISELAPQIATIQEMVRETMKWMWILDLLNGPKIPKQYARTTKLAIKETHNAKPEDEPKNAIRGNKHDPTIETSSSSQISEAFASSPQSHECFLQYPDSDSGSDRQIRNTIDSYATVEQGIPYNVCPDNILTSSTLRKRSTSSSDSHYSDNWELENLALNNGSDDSS